MRRSNAIFHIFNYSLFVILGFVTLYPFWHTLVGSLIPFSEYARKTLLWFPEQWNFAAYERIFSTSAIPNAYRVTAFSTIVGTSLSLFFTLMGAYVLTKSELPGRNIFLWFILFTFLFSGGLIPLYLTLGSYHLLNSVWVYVLPGLVNTFYLIIMKTSLQGLPKEVEESAKIDGCSELGILFRIIIPVSLPILATIGLFYAVDRWNELFAAIFFIRDADKMSLQGVLYGMVSGTDTTTQNVASMNQASLIDEQVKFAAIIAATLPILAVYPFLQRFFIKGVLVGAVKG